MRAADHTERETSRDLFLNKEKQSNDIIDITLGIDNGKTRKQIVGESGYSKAEPSSYPLLRK